MTDSLFERASLIAKELTAIADNRAAFLTVQHGGPSYGETRDSSADALAALAQLVCDLSEDLEVIKEGE